MYINSPGLKKACYITKIEFICTELKRGKVNVVMIEEMEQR